MTGQQERVRRSRLSKTPWDWGTPQSRKTLWGEEAQRSGRILGHFVPKQHSGVCADEYQGHKPQASAFMRRWPFPVAEN